MNENIYIFLKYTIFFSICRGRKIALCSVVDVLLRYISRGEHADRHRSLRVRESFITGVGAATTFRFQSLNVFPRRKRRSAAAVKGPTARRLPERTDPLRPIVIWFGQTRSSKVTSHSTPLIINTEKGSLQMCAQRRLKGLQQEMATRKTSLRVQCKYSWD